MDKDREAFEAFARKNTMIDLRRNDLDPSFYEVYATQDAWRLWQAALAYVRGGGEREQRLRGALRQAPLCAAYMVHGGFDEAAFIADYDAWFVQRNEALVQTRPTTPEEPTR